LPRNGPLVRRDASEHFAPAFACDALLTAQQWAPQMSWDTEPAACLRATAELSAHKPRLQTPDDATHSTALYKAAPLSTKPAKDFQINQIAK
jgi:hypothetical protein